eukprot:Amastigsp_a513517_11.p6 type:complete len:102 gc:universal Amastigsp_a513517_11:1355-1660(+)
MMRLSSGRSAALFANARARVSPEGPKPSEIIMITLRAGGGGGDSLNAPAPAAIPTLTSTSATTTLTPMATLAPTLSAAQPVFVSGVLKRASSAASSVTPPW